MSAELIRPNPGQARLMLERRLRAMALDLAALGLACEWEITVDQAQRVVWANVALKGEPIERDA